MSGFISLSEGSLSGIARSVRQAAPCSSETASGADGTLDIIEQIERVKAEHGWTMPFYSSRGTTFPDDCGAGPGFVLSAFLRDGDDVYQPYSTTSRGVDRLMFVNNIQDHTAYGRRED